jgi:3-hydroxybutyrate dehydrogenase
MDLNRKDSIVLPTGPTGGIGSAIAHAFAKEGAKLALSSTRQEKLERLIPTLGVDADHAKGFVVDATKEEEVKAFVEGAKEAFGTIDIVVANAGYEGKVCPIAKQSTDEFTKVYTLNVYSPMWLMKYAAPVLQEKKHGSIVVLASAGSYTPTATMQAYVSSKYAVAGLTKCVAQELMPQGIHVNYICPGPVDTDMMRRIEKDTFGDTKTHEEAEAIFASTALDKRYAKPEEVANAVLVMASDITAHTTGMGFNLDAIVPSH